MTINMNDRCKEMLITQINILAPKLATPDINDIIKMLEHIKKDRKSVVRLECAEFSYTEED